MVQDVSPGPRLEQFSIAEPLRDLLFPGHGGHLDAVQALAREVIIRLEKTKVRLARDEGEVDPADIVVLCDALLSSDETAAENLVLAAAARGMPPDTLHLSYIAEAARMMGDHWNNDTATSAEVIIGASRIYAIMRRLRGMFVSAQAQRPDKFRAVFAAAPGETYTIGLTMAADHLRRRGHEPYPIIGLSGSSPAMIFPLSRLIVALRVSNPGAWITIGGHIVDDEPDIVRLIDADARVVTLDDAVAQMEMVIQGGLAKQRG
jgi:MerR family transcriptional regulator, light-induced transcriptional regulator